MPALLSSTKTSSSKLHREGQRGQQGNRELARALRGAELTLSHTLAVGTGPRRAWLPKGARLGIQCWNRLVRCASTSDRMQRAPNLAASVDATKSANQALGECLQSLLDPCNEQLLTPTQDSAPRDSEVHGLQSAVQELAAKHHI